ncbi:MAG TPA: sigma-70 family RNA polymerase sigma factor [Candidatus Binatia bacterium]|jgi:RNA polymerase sigma-70 factor (ECF subfamily)|nr:sigma-70 family RNA polymerase sigma factor [Candidatus Binatia bacterium]
MTERRLANLDDHDLLARIHAGDKAACAECIERHAPGVYHLALRLLQNESDAEDVMQETFLSAFQAIDGFEGRATLKTWLYRIAYNAAMMRLRRETMKASASVEVTLESASNGYPLPRQFYDWCCLPEPTYETEEVRQELEQAITALPETLRGVFILRELQQLSTAETADALDVSQEVVKTRLRRARLALRERLTDYFTSHQDGANSPSARLQESRRER